MEFNDVKKKYILMENVLIHIHSNTVALEEKATRRNNIILKEFTDKLIQIMKQKDQLFSSLYKEKYYGGSFYDNLKVGDPDEFDLDLLLNLPDVIEPTVIASGICGYVKVRVKELYKLSTTVKKSTGEQEKIQDLLCKSLLDSTHFLCTDKMLRWFEGLIVTSLSEIPKDDQGKTFMDILVFNETIRVLIEMRKGGPAFTMQLSVKNNSNVKLDIDLVPSIKFHESNWPSREYGYKRIPATTNFKTFLVVPKKPKEVDLKQCAEIARCWRLSFQEQERELLSGNDKQFLKPAVKLLKKLRDNDNHKIASYFIKTIFLWSVEEQPIHFWSQSLSLVFMCMLKKYEEYLRSNNIPYFWNPKYNLIGYLKDSTKSDIANRLKRIISTVERSLIDPVDPNVIGKYLLSKEEFERLPSLVVGGKKQKKLQMKNVANNVLKSNSTSTDTSGPLEVLNYRIEEIEDCKQYLDNYNEIKSTQDYRSS